MKDVRTCGRRGMDSHTAWFAGAVLCAFATASCEAGVPWEPSETADEGPDFDEVRLSDERTTFEEQREDPYSAPVANPPMCMFDGAGLPARVGRGSYGKIAFDRECDLIVAGADEAKVYELRQGSVDPTVIAESFPGAQSVVAVAFWEPGGLIFASTAHRHGPSQLFAIGAGGGVQPVMVVDDQQIIRSLAVAPDGWGEHGRKLVAAWGGHVKVIDPVSLDVTEIAELGGLVSDVAFTLEGVLYAADFYEGRIHVVRPDGSHKPVATGLEGPDGIAVSREEHVVYVAEAWSQRIRRVDLVTAEMEEVVTGGIGQGAGVTGMLVEANGALLYTAERYGARMVESVQP